MAWTGGGGNAAMRTMSIPPPPMWRAVTASKVAIAIYPFTANGRFEVSLEVGDRVQLEEEISGWYKGLHLPSQKRGIFPAIFVVAGNTFEALEDETDVVLFKLQTTLKTWNDHLQNLLAEDSRDQFHAVKQQIVDVVSLRQRLLSTSHQNKAAIKAEIKKAVLQGEEVLKGPKDKRPVAPQSPSSPQRPQGQASLRMRLGGGGAAATLRKRDLQVDEEGIMALYQKHVDQRSKMSGQLKENNRLTTAPSPLSPRRNNRLVSSGSFVKSQPQTPPLSPVIPRALPSSNSSAALGGVRKLDLQQELRKQFGKDSIQDSDDTNSRLSQIIIDMKVFMCSTGEPNELYFSLYNMDQKKFISEEYRIALTINGMPEDETKIGKLKGLFKDVTAVDMASELYLVCRLIRRGKIISDATKKTKKETPYRRPFGCAVLHLTAPDVFPASHLQEKEHTMIIYTANTENEIANLHDLIPKNQNLVTLPHAKGLAIGLSLFKGSHEDLITIHPNYKETTTMERLGFPEVIMPGLVRHDFYLELVSAEISKNEALEVSAFVKLDDGEVVDCILLGTGEQPVQEYRSMVINKEPNPHWGERLNLKVPEYCFDRAHLYFTIKLCSDTSSKDKEFGFAFLPLKTQDGTVIPDTDRSLQIYSMPKSDQSPVFYLKAEADKQLPKLLKKGELLKVRTLLCSTKLTTNQSVLSLLNWTRIPGSQLPDLLNKITYIPPIEVLKFLREGFDAMFAIIDSNISGVDVLVADALVFFINILVDERKQQSTGINLRPVLDTYISSHFCGTLAHQHLMKCMKHYFQLDSAKQKISKLILVLKALEYLFKFIIASRLLYQKQASKAPSEDVWFKKDLLDLMGDMNQMMKQTAPEYRGAQVSALKNFGLVLDDLDKIFTVSELCSIVVQFIQCVHYDPTLKLLNLEKLSFISRMIASKFFMEDGARKVALTVVLDAVSTHLKSSFEEERAQCISILNGILYLVETKFKGDAEFLDLIKPHMQSIMKALPTFKGNERLDAVTCFLTLFHIMKGEHFESLFDYLAEKDDNWNFILKLYQNFQSFILAQTYPDSWLPLIMFQYNIILKVIMETTKYIGKSGLKKDSFLQDSNPSTNQASIMEVWKQFFRLATFYVQSKALGGITWGSEAKQKEINDKCNKFRLGMVLVLKNMWGPLGAQKVKFLQYLIGPFIELQLVNVPEIQRMSADLYFNAIEVEYSQSKGSQQSGSFFPKVETLTIDTLDKMASKGEISEGIKIFLGNLEERMKKSSDKELQEKGLKFVNDIHYFLRLLSALRTLPEGPEYEDDRTVANMKLMEYLKETNRRDAYVRYIQKLVEQHTKSNNYTEAAEALLLHSKLYKFNDEKLGEISGEFPAQTQRQRKEQLYQKAINLFSKGKVWERSIALIKELRDEYQFGIQNYENLADLIELHSNLIGKMLTEPRFFAEYFRVGYYGKGFDKNISGKEFIYRGMELERRDEFIERIHNLFPNAEVLTYADEPPATIIEGAGQYVQITRVIPTSEEELQGKPSKVSEALPIPMQKYYTGNDVSIFVYSKPFKKSQVKTDNDFEDLWLLNSYFFTEDTFPTIHRRSQIVKKQQVEVDPLSNACKAIKDKNKELLEIMGKIESGAAPLQDFTMILQGVLHAAVNGGILNYSKAFLTPEYLKKNANKKDLVSNLNDGLAQQLNICELGLGVHKDHCEANMIGLHQLLEEKFAEMKDVAVKNLAVQ